MSLIVRADSQLPVIKGQRTKLILVDESYPYSDQCQINATNDVEAVYCWLDQYRSKNTTFKTYRRESERLLLWCCYRKGKSLANLKVNDFDDYFKFLSCPPQTWCGTKKTLRQFRRGELGWKPFLGPLSQSALMTAVRVINSLINYLVQADYLRTNPIKLIKKYNSYAIDFEEQKYKVWSRMLEADEWQAVQDALKNMPDSNYREIDHKLRTQFLFALFYLLGLRINEVATHSWNAFREYNGNWWFFVKGKGDKLGHIPVNDQLLDYVKTYRIYLNKVPLPTIDDTESLLVSKKTKRPLSDKQLHSFVKEVGIAASKLVADPVKKNKLEKLSPHWLRHLSASHQDRAGIPAAMIQANHRHASFQTTQIYIHAEDELRSSEMSKIRMQNEPKIFEEQQQKPDVVNLEIVLSKGPLCKEESFSNLLEQIETSILSGYSFTSKLSRNEVIVKYGQAAKLMREFSLNYEIVDLKDEELDFIKSAINIEASIRLFKCEVSY